MTFDVPLEYCLFGLTLIGVAALHKHAFWISIAGLGAVTAYKILIIGFPEGAGLVGFQRHFVHEWVLLANLLLLLLGFALLANQFELSNAPEAMPRLLPQNWTGGLCLLGMIFVLSSILDNIAGAVVGGVIARHAYRDKIGVGFLAAIVAAANSGGAGSVIGDTTTTMIWIAGISPLEVAPAFVGGAVALAFLKSPRRYSNTVYRPSSRTWAQYCLLIGDDWPWWAQCCSHCYLPIFW